MNRVERNRLVVENLPLVGYLVSEVCAKATHLSRDDLAQAGALALIASADAFDAGRGVPFGAFARRRIVGAFADWMRAGDWAPRSTRTRIKETLAVRETLAQTLGRTPGVAEIAAALGVDRDTAQSALADAARTLTNLDDLTAEYLVADIPSPEESALTAERLGYLTAAVGALPEKTRYIVEQIYFHDNTVTDLAEELGISHSAVSQQRSEGIRLLRDGLNTHYSDDDAQEYALQSRISPARTQSYLAAMAEMASTGLGTPRRRPASDHASCA